MANHKLNDVELNFEIELHTDKLREILSRVEHAKTIAMEGQVLRIKLNHNTCAVFREVGLRKEFPQPVPLSVPVEGDKSVKMQ